MMTSYEHPPLKADKGLRNGSCNRRACQAPGATWFNHGTRDDFPTIGVIGRRNTSP